MRCVRCGERRDARGARRDACARVTEEKCRTMRSRRQHEVWVKETIRGPIVWRLWTNIRRKALALAGDDGCQVVHDRAAIRAAMRPSRACGEGARVLTATAA